MLRIYTVTQLFFISFITFASRDPFEIMHCAINYILLFLFYCACNIFVLPSYQVSGKENFWENTWVFTHFYCLKGSIDVWILCCSYLNVNLKRSTHGKGVQVITVEQRSTFPTDRGTCMPTEHGEKFWDVLSWRQ